MTVYCCGFHVLGAMRKSSRTDILTIPYVMVEGETNDERTEYIMEYFTYVYMYESVAECERSGTIVDMNLVLKIMGGRKGQVQETSPNATYTTSPPITTYEGVLKNDEGRYGDVGKNGTDVHASDGESVEISHISSD